MYFFLAKPSKKYHIMVSTNSKWEEICTTPKSGNAHLIAKFFDDMYTKAGISAVIEVWNDSMLKKYKSEGVVA